MRERGGGENDDENNLFNNENQLMLPESIAIK